MTAELDFPELSSGAATLTPAGIAEMKAKARAHFDTKTQELNLEHTFNFEEAFDYCIENRKRQAFRRSIIEFEKRLKQLPEATGEDPYPLEHDLVSGMYRRRLTVPPETLTVTKIHATDHFWFLEKGTITIWSEHGKSTHTAPSSGITRKGTKRVIWHHDEVVFTTVHRTDHTTLSHIENQLIAKDFDDLESKLTGKPLIELSSQGEIV
jgi:hypothetical protein